MARMFSRQAEATQQNKTHDPWGTSSLGFFERPTWALHDPRGTWSWQKPAMQQAWSPARAFPAPTMMPIQRKATVSVPSDPLEKAADEGAEKLLRMEEPAFENGASGTIQRKCASCEDEDETNKIHAKREGGTNDAAMDTSSAIAAAQRPGVPLPGQTRAFFEPRMGADLSGVRIHTDAEAARAAAGVQAKAYTWRDKIVFGAGEYAPETDSGKRLLAHELMHWRQQAQGYVGERVHRDALPETLLPKSQWMVKTTTGNLQLREIADEPTKRPDGKLNTVGNLFPGTIVEIVAKKNDLGWYQVRGAVEIRKGEERVVREGFVHRRYLFPVANADKANQHVAAPPNGESGASIAAEAPGQTNTIAELPVTFLANEVVSVEEGARDRSGVASNGMNVTPAAGETLGISGAPLMVAGLSSHVFASGDMSWLSRADAAKRVLSTDYWATLIPRRNTVVLDRILNELPRDLAPSIANELKALEAGKVKTLSWIERFGFSEAELRSIPKLIERYNKTGTLEASEFALLRRAAGIHTDALTEGAPFASYTKPNAKISSVGNRKFRVRVEMPRSSALDVSGPNSFNEWGKLSKNMNTHESEWLVTADQKGRILSVQRGAVQESSFLLRHAETIRWGGRVLMVVGAGISAYRIATATPEEQMQVIGEELGGHVLGFGGASALVAGCLYLGVASGGVLLALCGLAGGFGGGWLGSLIGGAKMSSRDRSGSLCPTCHDEVRNRSSEWQLPSLTSVESATSPGHSTPIGDAQKKRKMERLKQWLINAQKQERMFSRDWQLIQELFLNVENP